MKIDIACDEMPEAGHPKKGRRVEDVRADDFGRAEREDDQHRQAEEDTTAYRREAYDEAAAEPDQNRRDAIASRQDECFLRCLAEADKAFREHSKTTDRQGDSEDHSLHRGRTAAVAVLHPCRDSYSHQ